MTKRKPKSEYKKRGRPTVMTDEVLRKLEYAFSLGCNDLQACLYADISTTCFYEYLRKNPDFKVRKDVLKEKPVLLAKEVLKKNLTCSDKKERGITARWLLEKKCPNEYGNKADININTTGNLSIDARSDALDAFLKRFE